MNKRVLTLALVIEENRILLGLKKRGFGAGRWNGFGGKVEEGETVIEAAKRELLEESGLEWTAGKEAGELVFTFTHNDDELHVFLFVVTAYTGEVAETGEMTPRWFEFDDIPYAKMWPDDKYWLPPVLDGKTVHGAFLFDRHDALMQNDISIT